MLLQLSRCTVRDWRVSDLDRLVRLADNRKIWRNLRDRFPNPYTRPDGEAWIAHASSASPPTDFAIAVDDQIVGSIGVTLGTDIYARSGEVGYWLGEEYWGKGIAPEALEAFASWCFDTLGLIRLHAHVFVGNPASARVLEKAGFVREATLLHSAVKEGVAQDEWLYARTRAP